MHTERREALLDGILLLPQENELAKIFPKDIENIYSMWNSLWRNYITNPNNKLSIPFWYDKFTSHKTFNSVLKALSKGGWVTVNVQSNHNWGEFSLNTDKLLNVLTLNGTLDCDAEYLLSNVRAEFKYAKYKLGFNKSSKTKATRQNGKTRNTGLVREGFAKAGNTQFGYDTSFIKANTNVINRNLVKSMEKIREEYPEMKTDSASYDEIAIGVRKIYEKQPEKLYTCGHNFNDSRGRAISSCLSKLGNPISSKDFRSLLVVTYD